MLTKATRDVLQDIFDPIIRDILRLVDAQVKDAMLKRPGDGFKVINYPLTAHKHSCHS